MLEELSSLIALQALDTAADTARRRVAEMPGIEKGLDQAIANAKAAVDAVKARIADNDAARRALEKETAGIDARMAKFEEHKASVKTNQEFHALNHEIETAQVAKSALDDQVLELMAAADELVTERKAAEAAMAEVVKDAEQQRAVLNKERAALDGELARLAAERATAAAAVPAATLTKYDQRAKSRKGVAVSQMVGGICTGCNVRLRPHVEQIVRRNDSLTPCDSCQRILYYVPPPEPDATAGN
jgi:predicted  nucleic acid-binding Zn-ribbon protein